MKRLKIGVIDLVCKGPSNTLWAQIMHANLASIMPQVVATWCEQEGHEITMICYTGREGESNQLPKFYENIIQRDLGAWWQWLPKSALSHNANAYPHKEMNKNGQTLNMSVKQPET